MPLIDVQVLEGVYSDEEKSRIIEKLTQAFGEIAGRTMAEATSVRIHEIRSGSLGVCRQADDHRGRPGHAQARLIAIIS